MTRKVLAAVLAVACCGMTASAASAKRHRHHVRAPAPPDAVWSFASRYEEPAHFVRLPNGLVVSSYQCFTDEGYGRYRPCDAGRR